MGLIIQEMGVRLGVRLGGLPRLAARVRDRQELRRQDTDLSLIHI